MWQADYGLAEVFARQRNVAAAQHKYREVLQKKADFPEALTRLAWSLSTTANPNLRNGKEAISFAQQACALTAYRQIGPLQALAAAFAETGDFKQADLYAEKAQKLAIDAGQSEFARRIKALIDSFNAGQPIRETNSPPTHY